MANRYVVTDADRREQSLATPATAPSSPRDAATFVRGTVHSVTIRNGSVETNSRPAMRATASSPIPDGYVRLASGDVTPFAAVKAAGLQSHIVEHGGSPDGVGQGSREFAQATPTIETNDTAPDDEITPDLDSEAAPDSGQIDVSETEKATMEAATTALDTINNVVGAEVANAAIDDTIVSGELPTELPPGISHTQISAVVAGFEAQANAVLRETGASVDLLNEMLNDSELREARRAVFLNDDSVLQSLGAQAIRRLELLPRKPEKFQEMIAGFGPKVRVHRQNGETWVTTPNWDMSWSQAVRTGKISF